MILLINHFDPANNFGASVSLKYHLLWLKKFSKKIFLIFPINYIFSRNPYKNYKSIFLPIPYSFNIDHFSKKSDSSSFFQFIKEFLFKIFFASIFISKRFKVVHLNSTILLPLACFFKKVQHNVKIICHVREIVKPNLSIQELNCFRFVDIFICIDFTTYKSIYQYKNELSLKKNINVIILENPFLIYKKIKNPPKNKSFVFAGVLSNFKGLDFLYNLWINDKKLPTLKIIGRMIEKKFYPLNNVKIYNEKNSLPQKKIFYNSFALIRADPSFRIGRTCYEAICSGLYLILPNYKPKNKFSMFFKKHKKRILFYKARSIRSLKATIHKSLKLSYLKPFYFSNHKDYLRKISNLYFK